MPSLRLEGPQFALATLSFSALSATVLNEWESLTNGAQGLKVVRPLLLGIGLEAKGFYWLCLCMLGLVWMAMKNLLFSQWGRAFEALRDSPIATDAMGIGTYRHKVAGFALGSAMGGLAGGLYAFNFEYLQPHVFVYELMVILLLGVVLGGRKNLWGAFVGSILIVLLPNLLSNRTLFQIFSAVGFLLALGAGGLALYQKRTRPFQGIAPMIAMGLLVIGSVTVQNTEDWRKAIFALMLFSVVVGLPEGLMGFAARFLSKLFRIDPLPLAPPADLDQVLVRREADGSPILQLQELKCYFGGVRAVDGVSLTVRSGTIHGLIGPNGAGKTTTMRTISGSLKPTRGEIILDGTPVQGMAPSKIAHLGLAHAPEGRKVFGPLSVEDNLLLGAFTRLPRFFGFRARAANDLDKVYGLFPRLKERRKQASGTLSGGEQQMLAIGRALMANPKLVLLDEPSMGLAPVIVDEVFEIIRELKKSGITLLLVEQSAKRALEVADYAYVMERGRIVVEGAPAELEKNEKVVAAYLGR